MPETHLPDPALDRHGAFKRRAVTVRTSGLVTTRPLHQDAELPLVVEPTGQPLDLISWVAGNRSVVEDSLLRHGGILFRGFGRLSAPDLEDLIRALCGEALEYRERSSPRHTISGRVEDLPTNTYYGDGTPIEPETLDHLRSAYQAETVAFRWERGDLLLLDNMIVAHARSPFTGQRKVLVGMAEPVNR